MRDFWWYNYEAFAIRWSLWKTTRQNVSLQRNSTLRNIYSVIVARVSVREARRCARKPGNNVIEMIKGKRKGRPGGGGALFLYILWKLYRSIRMEMTRRTFTYVRRIYIGHRSVSVCETCLGAESEGGGRRKATGSVAARDELNIQPLIKLSLESLFSATSTIARARQRPKCI